MFFIYIALASTETLKSHMERVQVVLIMMVRLVFFLASIFLSVSSEKHSPSSFNVVSGIFIFGDSIFDAGNNHFNKNSTAQADFPPYGSTFFHYPTGRFTNGRTVADFISQFMGIDLQKPYLEAQIEVLNGSLKDYPSNGINFASAGSGVLQATNRDLGVTSLQEQLRQFQTLVEQNQINKTLVENSIFLFESGSNDIFNYFIPIDPPKLYPDAYVQAMLTQVSKFLDQIYKLGARRVSIFSLGPVGCVPARALLPGKPIDRCYGKMNVMVNKFNKGLESLVNDLPSKHRGVLSVYGAVYDIVQHFRATPTRYGFADVSSACCGEGTLGGMIQCGKEGYRLCPNPNEFLFWDYFHPSERAYKLISKALWAGKKSRIRPLNLKTLVNISLPHV